MRRSALVSGQFNYDTDFRYSQDFDLWTRMIPTLRFANLQKPLLRLREHPLKVSRAKQTEQQKFTNVIRERQINRLLTKVSDSELNVFAFAARGEFSECGEDLGVLESLLLQLIEANELRRIYPPVKFGSAAGSFFRDACRASLRSGQIGGARYLRSPLRFQAPPQSLRQRVTLLGLLGLALTGITRRP